MTVGLLDRRIQIQARDTALASDGSPTISWSTLKHTWAKKKDVPPGRRGEVFASEQHSDTLYTEWTVRWFDGATGAERIIDDSNAVYNAIGVPRELGRHEYLVFNCERGVVK